MNKQTEALKLALEALVYARCDYSGLKAPVEKMDESITAIREALAEQPAPSSHLTDEQKAANGLAWLARLEAMREEFAGLAEQPAQTLVLQSKGAGYGPAPSQRLEIGKTEQPAQQQEPVAWRELCRRLYVELYWCDRQMMETLDEDGEPVWTQGQTVRDVLADAKAALETSPPAQHQEPVAIHQVYRCKIKSRKQIDREIPRDQQGWWVDVAAGQKLLLRQAVQSDLDRCNLGGKRSKNPDDYMCETHTNGSLVSKVALEYMNPEQNVFASTSPPASKPWVGLELHEVRHLKFKSDQDWMATRDQELRPEWADVFACAIEAKLREKNA